MSSTRHEAALTGVLDEHGISYELLEHQRTMTATDEATSLGLPASERIDMGKLRDLLGAGKEVHLLTEDELGRQYPEFELGAVPPVGGREDRVLVDRRLAERPSIVLEAGSHERSVRVQTSDLVSLVGADTVDICAD